MSARVSIETFHFTYQMNSILTIINPRLDNKPVKEGNTSIKKH